MRSREGIERQDITLLEVDGTIRRGTTRVAETDDLVWRSAREDRGVKKLRSSRPRG